MKNDNEEGKGMRVIRTLVFLAAMPAAPVLAGDLDNLDGLSQAQFRELARDLGAIGSYKAAQPAEPYGIVGFDVSFGATVTNIEYRDAWQAASGEREGSVPLAHLSVTKGLPLDFDVGAYLATSSDGFRVLGAQLRYALHEGGVLSPAVGLRFATTRIEGGDQFDYATNGVDLSVSKGFTMLTPYAGVGRLWMDAEPVAATGLEDESLSATRWFAGMKVSLLLLQLTFEAERVGDTDRYTANLGFSF